MKRSQVQRTLRAPRRAGAALARAWPTPKPRARRTWLAAVTGCRRALMIRANYSQGSAPPLLGLHIRSRPDCLAATRHCARRAPAAPAARPAPPCLPTPDMLTQPRIMTSSAYICSLHMRSFICRADDGADGQDTRASAPPDCSSRRRQPRDQGSLPAIECWRASSPCVTPPLVLASPLLCASTASLLILPLLSFTPQSLVASLSAFRHFCGVCARLSSRSLSSTSGTSAWAVTCLRASRAGGESPIFGEDASGSRAPFWLWITSFCLETVGLVRARPLFPMSDICISISTKPIYPIYLSSSTKHTRS